MDATLPIRHEQAAEDVGFPKLKESQILRKGSQASHLPNLLVAKTC